MIEGSCTCFETFRLYVCIPAQPNFMTDENMTGFNSSQDTHMEKQPVIWKSNQWFGKCVMANKILEKEIP